MFMIKELFSLAANCQLFFSYLFFHNSRLKMQASITKSYLIVICLQYAEKPIEREMENDIGITPHAHDMSTFVLIQISD